MQQIRSGYFGCQKCHTLLQVSNGSVSSTGTVYRNPHRTRWIAPGTEGTLRGEKYQVIGYIVRQEASTIYYWSEYVMRRLSDNTTVFLSEYDGNWTLLEPVSDHPWTDVNEVKNPNTLQFMGRTYKAYSKYTAKYTFISGEIPWELSYKEYTKCVEFICPPYMLAVERAQTANQNWETDTFHGTYIQPKEISLAFLNGEAAPKRTSVGTIQPFSTLFRPRQFVIAILLFCLFAIGFSIYTNGNRKNVQVFSQHLLINDTSTTNKQVISQSFNLDANNSNLEIEFYSDVSNSWAALDLSLVNEVTGKENSFSMESSIYKGVEGGESWSEGSAFQKAFICGVTPGKYHFVLAVTGDQTFNRPISADVGAKYDVPTYWNEVLLCLILGAAALLVLYLEGKFESERWSYSNIKR